MITEFKYAQMTNLHKLLHDKGDFWKIIYQLTDKVIIYQMILYLFIYLISNTPIQDFNV